MTQKDLKQWQMLVKQVKNGYHLSNSDKQELLRLNHEVMLTANNIHNSSMFNNLN